MMTFRLRTALADSVAAASSLGKPESIINLGELLAELVEQILGGSGRVIGWDVKSFAQLGELLFLH